jgi:hypothetical protein
MALLKTSATSRLREGRTDFWSLPRGWCIATGIDQCGALGDHKIRFGDL